MHWTFVKLFIDVYFTFRLNYLICRSTIVPQTLHTAPRKPLAVPSSGDLFCCLVVGVYVVCM